MKSSYASSLSALVAKTIRLESGAHAGVNARPSCFVSARRSEPSERMTQTFWIAVPGVLRTYAIHAPSGDHAGSDSSTRTSEIFSGAPPVASTR